MNPIYLVYLSDLTIPLEKIFDQLIESFINDKVGVAKARMSITGWLKIG